MAALLVLVGGFSANYFSSSLYLNAAQNYGTPISFHEAKAYLIVYAKSQNKLEAETIKDDYPDCCKYIWKDGEYYLVVHSAYEMENDANKVKLALEKSGMKIEIKPVAIPPFEIEGNFVASEVNLLNECHTSFIGLFRNLCDLHIGLETGVYSEAHCQEKLKKLSENHQKLREKLDVYFQNAQNPQIVKLSAMMSLAQECINKTEANIESIKFASVQILDILRG